MDGREQTNLTRNVQAVIIPDGTRQELAEGQRVMILQELGGSFTVTDDRGAMFRIDERDADAVGKEPPPPPDFSSEKGTLEEHVWAQMKKCFDPEIPVNIVDLGLVYDCWIGNEQPNDGGDVAHIQMTLTAPGCGMGPVIADDVRRRVEEIDGISKAEVDVVLDPPWNQNMMSEAAKLQLGFL